jgi:acyl-CoA synthetase (AMP-forming)/AMP-acid ligase II
VSAAFWPAAEREPERLALVEPDGRAWSAGALAARCNQVVHGLRARGLGRGDAVAVLLPNGEPLVATLLAVMQAGWHWVPLNTSLTASEAAWILADSEARAFVAHARFGEVAAAAADAAGVPACEPAPGHASDDALREALLAHCRAHLASYKCPRTLEFTSALPRDPNGKLYKRKLRDPYWVGRERRI